MPAVREVSVELGYWRAHGDKGHSLLVPPRQCMRAPPKPSDRIERPAFSVSKITVSKERKKTSLSKFCLEEKGFRDQQEKELPFSFNKKVKRGDFFFFCFALLSVEAELIKVPK